MAEASNAAPMTNSDHENAEGLLSRVEYRVATPTDIFQCFELEQESYPPDKAASKNTLRYRQHHAAVFFRCAVLEHEDEETDEDVVIGYICSTRSEPDEDDSYSMSNHPGVSSLMIHTMVVRKEYQHSGLGKHMMNDYIASLQEFNASSEHRISRVVLFVKDSLLVFYLQCGFSVLRPSRSVKAKGTKYFLERKLKDSSETARKNIAMEDGMDCYIVDSFASAPGTGNPAAVVLLPKETNAEAMAKWMHTVAAEFNLSETAFCWPAIPSTEEQSWNDSEEHWNIRYYTPKVEISLCGHATLASAAILYQTLQREEDFRIVFHASEDDLTMELAEPSANIRSMRTRISMEFPSKPPRELTTPGDKMAIETMLKSAFDCELDPLYLGVSDIGDILIELKPDAFHEIGYEKINFKALMEWDGYYRGVIVCCAYNEANEENKESHDSITPDFLSRFFGPKAGINEDPVTGSAHCVLGPYYSQKLDKQMVIGKQMSVRKGSVECLVTDGKVRLTGTAITTMTGSLWMKKKETLLVQRITRERSGSIFDD